MERRMNRGIDVAAEILPPRTGRQRARGSEHVFLRQILGEPEELPPSFARWIGPERKVSLANEIGPRGGPRRLPRPLLRCRHPAAP